jgi:hypothetical protein
MSRSSKPENVKVVDQKPATVSATPVVTPVEAALPEIPEAPVVATAAPVGNTAVIMPISNHGTFKNPGDVNFKVHYPDSYKGERNMEQGSVHVVSQESADHFTKLGIGKIVK